MFDFWLLRQRAGGRLRPRGERWVSEVLILIGSMSDRPKMEGAVARLAQGGVSCELAIISAHRDPELLDRRIANLDQEGIKVVICAAGMAAHLAGAVAARCVCPVIGVPLSGSALSGWDALLSTVQMPRGVPVATVGVDQAENAAVLAIQILAVGSAERQAARQSEREKRAAKGRPE